MNDHYLDSMLITLIDKGGQAFKEQDLLRTTELSRTGDFDTSIRYLDKLGYISIERVSYDYLLTISTEGKRFIETGGFRAAAQRNDAAAQANNIAKSARLISIIAIIVSAAVALLVAYMEFVHGKK